MEEEDKPHIFDMSQIVVKLSLELIWPVDATALLAPHQSPSALSGCFHAALLLWQVLHLQRVETGSDKRHNARTDSFEDPWAEVLHVHLCAYTQQQIVQNVLMGCFLCSVPDPAHFTMSAFYLYVEMGIFHCATSNKAQNHVHSHEQEEDEWQVSAAQPVNSHTYINVWLKWHRHCMKREPTQNIALKAA